MGRVLAEVEPIDIILSRVGTNPLTQPTRCGRAAALPFGCSRASAIPPTIRSFHLNYQINIDFFDQGPVDRMWGNHNWSAKWVATILTQCSE